MKPGVVPGVAHHGADLAGQAGVGSHQQKLGLNVLGRRDRDAA